MTTNVVPLGDLLTFAESECGYPWNTFISMLERDRFLPYYESPLFEIYIGAGKDYGWSAEVSNVINRFCLSFSIDRSDA